MNVEVNLESPMKEDVVQMINALDSYLESLYPSDSNHLLEVEALANENVRFLVARVEGRAVGCGALVLDLRGYGEIKRMYVDSEQRELGIGRTILLELEKLAVEEDQKIVRLETGVEQHPALRLYRNAGYTDCGPFGDYALDPLSVFMEKILA